MRTDERLRTLTRYTITSEGASKGYFRLVVDEAGQWVTWPEIEAVLAELAAPAPQEAEPITVVVNGQPVTVKAGPVSRVIREAIATSGQIGAPLSRWELRTRGGDVIPQKAIDDGEFELVGGRLLFLTLGLAAADGVVERGAPQEAEPPRETVQDVIRDMRLFLNYPSPTVPHATLHDFVERLRAASPADAGREKELARA